MPKTKRNIARKAKRLINNQQQAQTSHEPQATALTAPLASFRTSPTPPFLAGKLAEPEGLVLSAQVEGLGIQTERSETPAPRPINLEQTRSADATPSGHTVPVDRSAPISHTAPQSGEPPAEAASKTRHQPLAANHGDGDVVAQRNRQNAQHSTGPRTEEGKTRSAQNALKHGLSIERHVILHGEDPAAYQSLLAELREIYEPQSRREDLSVEDIAQCRWALQRFDKAEAVFLNNETDGYDYDPKDPITVADSMGYAATTLVEHDQRDRPFVEPDRLYRSAEKIHRYRGHWERKHQRALAEFDRAQQAGYRAAREDRQQADAQRKQEAHDLRMLILQERLEREQRKNAAAAAAGTAKPESDPIHRALNDLLATPPPVPSPELLAKLGFVSPGGQFAPDGHQFPGNGTRTGVSAGAI